MNILCNGLVILGAVVLSIALLPVRGILKQLPQGAKYSQWKILAGLMGEISYFLTTYISTAVCQNPRIPNKYGRNII